MSTMDMRTIPVREAKTPISFLYVNCSTWKMAPKRSVKMLLVEVRIVELATLVYSKQDATK